MVKHKKSSVMETVKPDLRVPPHVVDKLVKLFTHTWQPDTAQQEQLTAHLIMCSSCRTFLIALLGTEEHNVEAGSNSEHMLHDLFMRFVNLHHTIESQEDEQLGAYAEAIIAEKKKEADKRFPLVAAHVKSCPDCKAALEETLAFLKESEESD